MTAEHDNATSASVADLQAQTARIARELGDNAHQVWLAGIGALNRAQSEGSRLFEQLAEEGRQVGEGATPAGGAGAAGRLEGLRQNLDAAMGRAQARAGEAWESMGRVFEQRVQQTLRQLDVPTRDDLDALGVRIDALTRELQRQHEANVHATPTPADATANASNE
jgi:poly(hydroxyalkanoate) granule-associated protein